MTVLQAHFRGRRGARKGFVRVAAVVCLMLLALLFVAQVVHLHPTQSDADHCQLCIVMHTLVPVAQSATAVIVVQLGASAPQLEPEFTACQFLSRVFIRPPPASC